MVIKDEVSQSAAAAVIFGTVASCNWYASLTAVPLALCDCESAWYARVARLTGRRSLTSADLASVMYVFLGRTGSHRNMLSAIVLTCRFAMSTRSLSSDCHAVSGTIGNWSLNNCWWHGDLNFLMSRGGVSVLVFAVRLNFVMHVTGRWSSSF